MVFAWGVIVVFVPDKFIRTVLVGDTIRLGFVWVLVGGLAGLETFGLRGLIIGPVILAMTGALLRDSIGGIELMPRIARRSHATRRVEGDRGSRVLRCRWEQIISIP